MKAKKKEHSNYGNLPGAKRRREFSLSITCVTLVIFFIFMDQSVLPDYDAYERIFENSLIGEEWEIFYIYLNFIFRENGFLYSDFRNFILVFSSTAMLLTLTSLPRQDFTRTSTLQNLEIILIFLLLAVFVFEYFVIRIRAGLSMGIFFCAIYLILSTKSRIANLMASLLILMALLTHQSTALILLIFVGLPFVASTWKIGIKIKNNLFISSGIVCVSCLLYVTNSSYELRGEHIYSPLNYFRFLMLSVVPMIIFFLIKNEAKIDVSEDATVKNFPIYFARLYVILAIGLAFMYYSALTGESGEALVRLYTLSSIPALLSLKISGLTLRAPFGVYILIVNSLFFLVTVYLPK